MGALPPLVGIDTTLATQAVAGPNAFAALAYACRRRIHCYAPLRVAIAFTVAMVAMDTVVVALLVLHSLDMFRSGIGTSLPFALIFLASWGAGTLARRRTAL